MKTQSIEKYFTDQFNSLDEEHQILIGIFHMWYKQASQAEQQAFATKFFNPSTQSDAIDDLIEWAGQQ